MILAALLACHARVAEPKLELSARAIGGPWAAGHHLAVASPATHVAAGPGMGQGIAQAAWVEEGKILLSSTLNGGLGWGRPQVVAEGVPPDTRPLLAISGGGSSVAWIQDGALRLMQSAQGPWQAVDIGAPPADHAELALVDGQMVLSWTGSAGIGAWDDLGAWQVSATPACSRPAAGVSESGAVLLAVREESGIRVFRRGYDGWEDRGLTPVGGGCAAGAPAWTGPYLAWSDGKSLLVNGVPRNGGGWSVVDVRAAGGRITLVETKEGRQRLNVQGDTVVEGPAIELGAPALLGQELWVPIESDGPRLIGAFAE